MDGARSDDSRLDALLVRLMAQRPGPGEIGLERVEALLDALGNPERRLPPVFHVAGTNGKGSTCAYLRAALEAAGHKVHIYTSPHLVRFNERIRIAGQLVDDAMLADLLEEVMAHPAAAQGSFFEVTTAAAFLAFSRVSADACVVEVGLGGRLDATNLITDPISTGIAQLGLDHQAFLGERLEDVAAEKAGIAKPGAPLVLSHYPPAITQQVMDIARARGAQPLPRGGSWDAAAYDGQLHYRDGQGKLKLPLPRLAGAHQLDNAVLAVAMLRHQNAVRITDAALKAAMGWADWPARLQRLDKGPLTDLLPAGSELWLDGGHNPAAARALADALRSMTADGRPLVIILGMLANKDAAGFLKSFAGRTVSVHGVPVPAHEYHPPEVLAKLARAHGLFGSTAADVRQALGRVALNADPAKPPLVLIAGSLYLAGEVLRDNEQVPV